jgi:PAS domain S-box-containing protein
MAREGEPLPESEAWYRQFVETLPQLLWTCRADGSLDYASKRLLTFLGVPEAELFGRGWLDSVNPEDREHAGESWARAVATGSEFQCEFRFRRHDGAYRWMDVRAHPLLDDDGKVVKWFGAYTDIHDRREVQEALRIEQQRLEKMAAASPQALHSFRKGPDGTYGFPYVSPAFTKVLGVESDELARDPSGLFARYHPEDMRGMAVALAESERTMSPWRYEWRVEVPGRGEVWVEAHSTPVRDADGGITWHGTLDDVTERRRKDAELRESELRFRQIANAIDHVFWMMEIEPRERITYVSPPVERLWGRKPREFYENPRLWMESIHEADRPRVRAAFEHWLKEPYEHQFQFEYRLQKQGEDVRWVLDRGWAIQDKDVPSLRIARVVADITERKRSEEALVASNERFEQIAESVSHILWVLELEPVRRVSYVSPSFEKIWGRKREELYQDPDLWMASIDERDRPAAKRAYEHWLRQPETEQVLDTEYRVVRPDGTRRWIHDTGRSKLDPTGKPLRVSGVAEDVTARKEAELMLREERDRLAKMAATSPVVLQSYRWRPDGSVSFPFGAERLALFFELPAEELERDARDALERIHPDDRERVERLFEYSRTHLTPWDAEFRLLLPKRGLIWVEGHSVPVPEPDGAVVWHGAIMDVTERKRTEGKIRRLNAELEERVAQRTAELEAANAELEEANRELEAFSYSVSHDLRAPLRTVNGFSQALLEDFGDRLPEEARRYLLTIRGGAQRMAQLIDDLLAFSRLGRKPLKRREVDVTALVRECLDELGHPQKTDGAEVVIGELPRCVGDPSLLRQVFSNLLSNAFKYSRHKKPARIEVGSRVDSGGRVVYFVRDNGTGFDMAYAHRLFKVFQRLHREEEFDGTGVGLAIVKRIVTRHGGQIWAEAAPDRGATFSFTLGC